ncbi:TIGR03089 family protein [Isoptericola cucumis]|uniref:TIGR03089 family protein n=1 Tax=Isoptericola cucumis TaxID=1776856 RepID=A0ABQ2B7W3_9MICO|nr:TIGR03089 family protein [Isoptericola cucumis]GGI09823.1 TIGR03089 family protein [Isoptericola cucumis]
MNPAIPARDLPGVLDLVVTDPGRPRLTWYGDGGERVELSGAVLVNWVSKTVNLLVEEMDAAPGSVVVVDLPVHWRAATWALAAWRCGATVVVPGEISQVARPDVVVTWRPEAWADAHRAGTDLVAVALPALARRFDGDLPPGAVDAAGAVMTYGDAVSWAPDAEPARVALEALGTDPVTFADLVAGADAATAAGGRVLVAGDRPAGAVLRDLLALWASNGSVVLTSGATAAELRADPARLARLRETERITAGEL